MIHHISIGVANIERSKAFYDAAFAPLGYTRLGTRETWLGYGKERVMFSARAAEHPVPPDPKSGLHFCFIAPTRESVDAFHAAALANGGVDNGAPGVRAAYSPNYYAAYVIDPDGYRIEAYCAA